MTPPHAPHAVIFDNDGVLVDSEPHHRAAWEKVFARRGITVSDAEYAWSIGRRDITFAERVVRQFGLSEPPETLRDEKRARLLRLLATDALTFEGLPELVRALARLYPLGVATSAMREEIDIVLDRFGLRPHIRAVVTNEDVPRHKPAPDPYLLCSRRLGVAPERCVAFEDSVSGIEAAKAAGMRVIAFTSTFSADVLSGADAVVDDLADTSAVLRIVRTVASGQA